MDMSEPTQNMINSGDLPDHESCEISLDEIKLRRNGDTRSLNISHVFNLADSIESMGLITSIAVDRDGYLIAGGHRLMALKLLNPTTRAAAVQKMICQERSRGGQEGAEKSLRLIDELRSTLPVISNFNFDRVGVNIYELSSAELPDKAIAIEIAENMIREDYSPREVFELYELLLIKGFTDPLGRPKKGERAVKPAIAAIIGKSVRTVRRKLEQARSEAEKSEPEKLRDKALKIIKSVQRVRKQLSQLEPAVAYSIKSSIEWSAAREGLLAALALVETLEPQIEPQIEPHDESDLDYL